MAANIDVVLIKLVENLREVLTTQRLGKVRFGEMNSIHTTLSKSINH